MNWFHHEDAIPKFEGINCVAQEISVAADLTALRHHIPVPPQLILRQDGPPSSVYRWFGQIDARYLTIECPVELSTDECEHVTIATPYDPNARGMYEWSVIMELQTLPPSIVMTRPLFIQSRAENPQCVVY